MINMKKNPQSILYSNFRKLNIKKIFFERSKREKNPPYLQRSKDKNSHHASQKPCQRKEMDEIFKVLTGETHKARSMYPANLSSVSEEIKTSQTSKNVRNWLPVELPCKKCQKFFREEENYIDQNTVSLCPERP